MKRVLAAFCVLLLFTAGCSADKGNQVIAEVNGVQITQAQFDQRYALVKDNYEMSQNIPVDENDTQLKQNLEETTFNNLIIMELIRQDASKRGLKVSDAEINENVAYIKEMKDQQQQDGYKQFLKQTGMSEKDLQEEIRLTLLSSKLAEEVTKDIKVTDEEVRKYYDENPSLFEQPGGIEISHILVKDEKTARSILEKAQAGEDFAELARKHSLDPGSKEQGGELGPINEDADLVPEFKKAALALKPGEISPQPIKSDYGFHIIKAGERIEASRQSFEEVEDQVRFSLERDKKAHHFDQYLKELQDKAKIKDLRKNK